MAGLQKAQQEVAYYTKELDRVSQELRYWTRELEIALREERSRSNTDTSGVRSKSS